MNRLTFDSDDYGKSLSFIYPAEQNDDFVDIQAHNVAGYEDGDGQDLVPIEDDEWDMVEWRRTKTCRETR